MADITSYTIEDLHKEIADKRAALRKFRFGSAGTRARNTREGRGLRKDIARLMTEVSKRNIAAKKKVA
jgi:ribosomal protein L29